eukprot:m.59803 g.59803  ORF g.59803 m.59803 type:complete len:323 (+) comp7240_c0_seq2:2-970(+)
MRYTKRLGLSTPETSPHQHSAQMAAAQLSRAATALCSRSWAQPLRHLQQLRQLPPAVAPLRQLTLAPTRQLVTNGRVCSSSGVRDSGSGSIGSGSDSASGSSDDAPSEFASVRGIDDKVVSDDELAAAAALDLEEDLDWEELEDTPWEDDAAGADGPRPIWAAPETRAPLVTIETVAQLAELVTFHGQPEPAAIDPSAPHVTIYDVVATLLQFHGADITVLEVDPQHRSLYPYVVLVSGNSARHLRAMAIEVLHKLKKAVGNRKRDFFVCGIRDEHWILVQSPHFVLHCMMPDAREYYGLERIWMPGWKRGQANEQSDSTSE